MAKCVACGKFLSSAGAATCTTCPGMYHKACVGISEIGSAVKDWVCPECHCKKRRKGDNSSTPVKNISEGIVAPPLAPDTVCLSSPAPPGGNSDLRDMRAELAEFMAESRGFHKEVRATMASMGERMNTFEQRLVVLEQREMPVAQQSVEVAELQVKVALLKSELNDRDQDMLLSDLDIGHIPEEKGENIIHTLTMLSAKLGITLEDRDIVFAERVGSVDRSEAEDGGGGISLRPRRVVVRLARRHLRDELLHAARVRRNLTTADFGLAGPPRRVYINERLTRSNRQLFHRVREECRNRQWKYSWTRKGRVFARQADGKPVHCFRLDADIARVFGTESVREVQ